MLTNSDADKARGGLLWKQLRCQKKRRKRYASGRDRRGQIKNRRPIAQRPASVERRSQVGHWEGDTVMGPRHKYAIVTMVERKSGFAIITKVSQKTSEQVSLAIIAGLTPFVKKFAQKHSTIEKSLQVMLSLINR